MFVTYFAVEAGHIEVIGQTGDEDRVRARLAGLDPDTLAGLRAAREDETPELAKLQGTDRQVAWAEQLRRERLARAWRDPALVAALSQVADSTWWIANRDRLLDELRARLIAPESERSRAMLRGAPPGGPGPPW